MQSLHSQNAGANRDALCRFVSTLQRVNRALAVSWGVILLITVGLILAEIILRQTPFGALRGSDEISGYVMAGLASWGLTYTLLERAHIRIDMLQHKLQPFWRHALDVLAMASVATVSSTVAFYSWTVLAKTIKRGSHANTPLETPLWIPQSIWFSGWVWFAVSSTALTIIALILFIKSRNAELSAVAGNPGSLELDDLHLDTQTNAATTPNATGGASQ